MVFHSPSLRKQTIISGVRTPPFDHKLKTLRDTWETSPRGAGGRSSAMPGSHFYSNVTARAIFISMNPFKRILKKQKN